MNSTKLIYLNSFPSLKYLAEYPIFIFDKHLLKIPKVKSWILSLPNSYGVDAGENLKQLHSFEQHTLNILKILESLKVKNVTLIAIGGGSVGDFVGFMASVLRRGVSLIQIPSTWLSAIDSSHGGKTALNLGFYKNQIGTFYPADKVVLCKELLMSQPQERIHDALGEVIKTALLAGGLLWNQISKENQFDSQKLWAYLPSLIQYKYKIVKKDPFEKKGLRSILNLGHTLGHTFEINYKLSHGWSVNLGIVAALELSKNINILSAREFKKLVESPLLRSHLATKSKLKFYIRNLDLIKKALLHDKKITKKNKLKFIFLEKPGKPHIKEIEIQWVLNQLKSISK